MKSLTLTLPDGLEMEDREVKRFLAAKLYESGKLSLGQAAELAGLSKRAFAEILSDYGVSYINYSSENAIEDAKRI